ncbi:hypothetical protein, partial [uncultured Duncaniella sp.]|uniref:hypothetical protein n=1 Tax=uncultured Duncaniella sp. TaxID=2768039 RepID=UPI0026776018
MSSSTAVGGRRRKPVCFCRFHNRHGDGVQRTVFRPRRGEQNFLARNAVGARDRNDLELALGNSSRLIENRHARSVEQFQI